MAGNISEAVANHYAEQARMAELAKLQRELADEFARSLIECNGIDRGDGWQEMDGEGDSDIPKAVRYLDLRGLIERDGERVRFKETPDA